jgi:hypothetical protein
MNETPIYQVLNIDGTPVSGLTRSRDRAIASAERYVANERHQVASVMEDNTEILVAWGELSGLAR